MPNGCEIGVKGLMRINMGLRFTMFYCSINKVPHSQLRDKCLTLGMGRFTIMFLCWVMVLKVKRWYKYVWLLH